MEIQPPTLDTELKVEGPFDLRDTSRVLQMGSNDPTMSLTRGRMVLARYTPAGPVTVEITQCPDSQPVTLQIQSWGAGSQWIRGFLPGLLGLDDDPRTFQPTGRLRRLHCRHIGMRLTRLPRAGTRVMQVVLMQLVSWRDAFGSWHRLVQRFGAPAPGPHDIRLPPPVSALRGIPRFQMIECGVIPKLARTLQNVAAHEGQLESAADTSATAFAECLRQIPGIGEWTTQYALGTALGHGDAILTGDYNLPHTVAWYFAGDDRGDDQRLIELLEPFRGHRFRVIRLLWLSGINAPRHGPRAASVRQRMLRPTRGPR